MKGVYLAVGSLITIVIGLVIMWVWIFSGQENSYDDLKNSLIKAFESSYFEGQKGALEGDIRIEKRDSGYVWIKSPWGDGREPIFNPNEQSILE